MKTGDLILTHSPFNWKKPLRYIPWAIRKITKSYWNHTASVVVLDGRIFVTDSDMPGVVLRPYETWIKDSIIEVRRPTFKVDEEKFKEKVFSRVGKTKYDFRSLFIKQLIWQTLGVWIPTKKEGKEMERFICSEYCAWLYELPESHKWTPMDFAQEDVNFSVV